MHGGARVQRRIRQQSHRKAWFVATAIVLLAAAGVVSFLMTKASERGVRTAGGGNGIVTPRASDDPALSPEAAAEISAAYEPGRRAWLEDDYGLAEQEFLRVWRHAEAPVQTAAWAGFEAVVAAYLDGRPGAIFGQAGDAMGDLAFPKGIAFDSDGQVYVVDSRFENVQIFEPSGQLLLFFGEEGVGPGQFWLPSGLFIDQMDRIWVCDSYNSRIQVFQYLKEVDDAGPQ